LADIIVSRIPEHKSYCEVFAGGLWVFFRKDRSAAEVVNDKDSNLVSFYRVLQNHLEEFLRQFKWLITSREVFSDFKAQLAAPGLTDIQKAARYYYLQRLCFGGRVRSRSFGVAPERPPRLNLVRLEEELSDVHLRFASVTIENLDWSDFVVRYDKPETFFYLDPPYFKTKDYEHNFDGIEDFQKMEQQLSGICGKWLLSINDRPEIREVFKAHHIEEHEVPYTVSKQNKVVGHELLISNYEQKVNACYQQELDWT
jgi:DNA adenine methylase